jgi:uncharacterized SAM-binding protein YcdF (DUF218 family)
MYQIITELAQPLVVFSVLALLGVANLWRKRTESRRRLLLMTVPVALLVLCSLPWVSYFAMATLEWPYPHMGPRPDDAEAIVVLGGYVQALDEGGTQVELGPDSRARCLMAVEVYRAGPRCPILVSGGKVEPKAPPVAEVMHDFMIAQGVRPCDLIVEPESRSTYENAVECRKLLEERGIHKIILVTEAFHMRRAAGCFQKQGLDVVTCGCRYRSHRFEGQLGDFLPSPTALMRCGKVTHEWLGVAWYKVQGRM